MSRDAIELIRVAKTEIRRLFALGHYTRRNHSYDSLPFLRLRGQPRQFVETGGLVLLRMLAEEIAPIRRGRAVCQPKVACWHADGLAQCQYLTDGGDCDAVSAPVE